MLSSGQNVTIRATGKLLELIDIGAKVHLSVKWIIIFLINKEFDLFVFPYKTTIPNFEVVLTSEQLRECSDD